MTADEAAAAMTGALFGCPEGAFEEEVEWYLENIHWVVSTPGHELSILQVSRLSMVHRRALQFLWNCQDYYSAFLEDRIPGATLRIRAIDAMDISPDDQLLMLANMLQHLEPAAVELDLPELEL